MNLLTRKEYHKISGIYKISNSLNDMIYIGSAVNLYNRCRSHYNHLKNNNHNIKLQTFVNENGLDVLKFNIIELVEDKNNLLKREQYWLDELKPYDNGFNIAKNATYSTLGLKTSDETKRKIGEKSKGRKKSAETLKNMSLNRKNKIEFSGENNNGLSILKEKDVILIKKMLLLKYKPIDIVKIFNNVNVKTIYNISCNSRWKIVQIYKEDITEYDIENITKLFKNIIVDNQNKKVRSDCKITINQIKYIKYLLINTDNIPETNKIIKNFYNINHTNLSYIYLNKSYKYVDADCIEEENIKYNNFIKK